MHQRHQFELSAQPAIAAADHAAFYADSKPAQRGTLPGGWWLIPAVIGGASIWVMAIGYVASALTGAA